MNPSNRSAPLDPHARSVAARFSAAAPHYDNHDDVQAHAAREVMRRVRDASGVGHALEIGCGTGRLTRLLVERCPAAAIDAIDISGRMIDVCRRRVNGAPRVRWHVGDARGFGAPGAYDLIVSSSSLHWILPRAPFLRHVRGLLAPGGTLAAAVMVRGTLAELHEARALVAPHKPAPAPLPEADEFIADLAAAGFTRLEHAVEDRRVFYASAADLLKSLHLQGLTGGDFSHGAQLLGRRELAALVAAYDARHGGPAQDGVSATFRVLYVLAAAEP